MIKSGYLLQITSWENDGDCYNTISLDGLNDGQVYWRIEFLKALRAQRATKLNEVDWQSLVLKVENLAGLFPDKFLDLEPEEDIKIAYNDFFSEYATKMIGSAYECDYMRTYESHKVYWIEATLVDHSAVFN